MTSKPQDYTRHRAVQAPQSAAVESSSNPVVAKRLGVIEVVAIRAVAGAAAGVCGSRSGAETGAEAGAGADAEAGA